MPTFYYQAEHTSSYISASRGPCGWSERYSIAGKTGV